MLNGKAIQQYLVTLLGILGNLPDNRGIFLSDLHGLLIKKVIITVTEVERTAQKHIEGQYFPKWTEHDHFCTGILLHFPSSNTDGKTLNLAMKMSWATATG